MSKHITLLIDGYNLLHASDVFVSGAGTDHFQRTRIALAETVYHAVGERQSARSVIVFDAMNAPAGLPRREEYRSIQLRYASDHASADALIEKIIEEHTAPRELTVVSSDHRIQRAARRCGARAEDSEAWYRENTQGQVRDVFARGEASGKPTAAADPADTAYWVELFSKPKEVPRQRTDPAWLDRQNLGQDSTGEKNLPEEEANRQEKKPVDSGPNEAEPFNPFPPGYGEDLLEDEDFY